MSVFLCIHTLLDITQIPLLFGTWKKVLKSGIGKFGTI